MTVVRTASTHHSALRLCLGTALDAGEEALRQWDAGALEFNVIDSQTALGTSLMPAALRHLSAASAVPEAVWLSYVLTPGSHAGKLHVRA